MTPTPTPPPTPTPFVWPTPTIYPTATGESQLSNLPSQVQQGIVEVAEGSVQGWNMANRDGTVDNFMSLVLLLVLILGTATVVRRLKKFGALT